MITDEKEELWQRDCPDCGHHWVGGRKTRCRYEVFHPFPQLLRVAQLHASEYRLFCRYNEVAATDTGTRKTALAQQEWYDAVALLRANGGTPDVVRRMLTILIASRLHPIRRKVNR